MGAELAELDELYGAVEELRGRAVELQELQLRLPAERAAAAAVRRRAEHAVAGADRRSRGAEEARAEAAGGRGAPRGGTPPRVRARDHLHIAERKAAASARELAAELEARAEAAERRPPAGAPRPRAG